MTHLEERLEKDLRNIRDRVATMAKQVEDAVANAVHALQTGNEKLAYATILGDHPINRTMREIDRLCHRFIAVHLPSAGHLRLLSSVIRVNIELERIGDYAVTIAREAVQLSAPPTGALAREMERLANEAQMMLRQSVRSFNELNADLARGSMIMADQIEHDLDGVYSELAANTERDKIKDALASFAIFAHLKRVADQAKNICEDTVFAVTGESKAPKVYRVLFVDEDNSCQSQMAAAIARNNFPESGQYISVGRQPAAALHPALVAFLQKRGIDISRESLRPLSDLTTHELAEQHVIVSFQGPVKSFFPEIPFHTSALEWDVGAAPEGDDPQRLEEMYRETALQVRDLMELLRGEGAS